MIRNIVFAGALLAASGATMSSASAAIYHANPAFHRAAVYRLGARQARALRAPGRVALRLPYRRTLKAAPSARVAFGRVRRPAFGRNVLAKRYLRIAPRIAHGGRFGRTARFANGHFAYRGYRRFAQRVPAFAMRYRALAPSSLTPRTVVAPVAVSAVGAQVGSASYYSGGRTASGGFVGAATCAHRWLPFGTRLLVTNLFNARQTMCVVNDRGPFIGGRIVDLSRGAAGAIGMIGSGVASVRLTVLGRS